MMKVKKKHSLKTEDADVRRVGCCVKTNNSFTPFDCKHVFYLKVFCLGSHCYIWMYVCTFFRNDGNFTLLIDLNWLIL